MFDYNSLTEEEQIKLVQRDGYSIQYIYIPSEAVQLAAVKNIGLAISYIDNPSEAVQLAAVKNHKYAIIYIKNPSETVQLAVVQENRYAIKYIKNPTKEVINYCLYECDISNSITLDALYKKLTSDKDKIYFKLKYGGIINV